MGQNYLHMVTRDHGHTLFLNLHSQEHVHCCWPLDDKIKHHFQNKEQSLFCIVISGVATAQCPTNNLTRKKKPERKDKDRKRKRKRKMT